ncbi:MAG: hypothetical protein ACNI25_16430 [Halarcobacter sp.]
MNKHDYIKIVDSLIKRKSATIVDGIQYRKNLGIKEKYLISSDTLIDHKHIELVVNIVLNLPDTKYISVDTNINLKNYVLTLSKNDQERFLFLEEVNRFKYIKCLDFYLYFFEYDAFEFLYDYDVMLINVLDESYHKTREEIAVEYSKNHEEFDKKLFNKENYLKYCMDFYGKYAGFNIKDIQFLYEHKEYKGYKFIAKFIEFSMYDNILYTRQLNLHRLNKIKLRKSHSKEELCFLDIL